MIDRAACFEKADWNEVPHSERSPKDGPQRAFVALQELLQGQVADELQEIQDLIVSATATRYRAVERLSSCVVAMGGKRLRPILAILSARVCCEPARKPSPAIADLRLVAASVELVHAASLVHDDVMDNAETRRHLPTIGSLAGSSAAILLGDYLFTKAYALAARCRSGYPARRIARAASALCEGELRQQLSVGRWELSAAEYHSILKQKTGALCAVSCVLGAWCGGGTTAERRALARFGLQLGLAFQLFDDWLDYWGTEMVGKTLGGDLRQRKPTLPTIRLLESLPHTKRPAMLRGLDRAADSQDAFDWVMTELNQSDASHYTLEKAHACVRSAIDCLEELPSSESKLSLEQLARFSVARVA